MDKGKVRLRWFQVGTDIVQARNWAEAKRIIGGMRDFETIKPKEKEKING
jgi:hypothetical protein